MDSSRDASSAVDAASSCRPPLSAEQLDTFLQAWHRAWCENITSCMRSLTVWSDLDQCMRYDSFGLALARKGTAYLTAHAAELTFDAESSTACLRELRTCADPGDAVSFAGLPGSWSDGCHVFTARCGSEAGDPCTFLLGCGPGLSCQHGTDSCDPEVGECTLQQPPGEPCVFSDECLPPDPSVAPFSICQREYYGLGPGPRPDGECRFAWLDAPVDEGSPCGPADASDEIVQVVPCVEGTRCDEETRRCVRWRGEGEDCTSTVECARPLYCDGRLCRVPDTRVPVMIGSPCVPDDACDAQLGARCVDGSCVQAGHAVGAPCARMWPREPYCEPPLLCDLRDECARPAELPLGAECAADGRCMSGCCVSSADELPACRELDTCTDRVCE